MNSCLQLYFTCLGTHGVDAIMINDNFAIDKKAGTIIGGNGESVNACLGNLQLAIEHETEGVLQLGACEVKFSAWNMVGPGGLKLIPVGDLVP